MSRVDHWPLFGLRVRTPRVVLAYPTDDHIAEIAQRSVTDGVHDPSWMPFGFEWTDVAPPAQQRNSMQFHWSLRANWRPDSWHCNLAAWVEGRIVGTQSAESTDFARLGAVTTGSFLFLPEQGRGIGTEMRAAVLHLAFEGLGASEAHTSAWIDNEASLAVTARLGYERVGSRRMLSRGSAREMVLSRLTREMWQRNRRNDITIEGVRPCLDLFGVPRAETCAGVDGCPAGWVVATRAGVRVVPAVGDVFANRHRVVGIDMPIGLSDTGARSADRSARRFLSPRGSTIFPTPSRNCLGATDYAEACARSLTASGKKISMQSWNILPKIAELDAAISTADEQHVVEVHPECSFAVMNDGNVLPSKHTSDGLDRRTALLEARFGPLPATPRGAGRDDVLDAYAVLWSAERFAASRHVEFAGDAVQRDGRGLLMRIVA